jgi:phage tail-like protein
MSSRTPFVYRFATAPQWDTCLASGLERDASGDSVVLQPTLPYGAPQRLQQSNGGFAPACTAGGEVLWRDSDGCLHRWSDCDDGARGQAAPLALSRAMRIVAAGDVLWCMGGEPATLECFDSGSLTRRLVVTVPVDRVLDLCADGVSGLFVLAEVGASGVYLHVDCAGCCGAPIPLTGLCQPTAIAFMRSANILAFLTEASAGLVGVTNGQPSAAFRVRFGSIRPCFTASGLTSDGHARFVVAGQDGSDFGAAPALLAFSPSGEFLSQVALSNVPTGLAATRNAVFLTDSGGLVECAAVSVVGDGSHIECILVTPMLRSPPGVAERPWLRAELMAALPAGTAAEVSYAVAASEDTETRVRIAAIVGDKKKIASQKLAELQSALKWSAPMVLPGSDALATHTDTSNPVAAPLSDAAGEYLWLRVRLTASPGSTIPSLFTLTVLYPERGLLDDLPAVYRRNAADPASFLRGLLGVLETTTQNLDARIAGLGALIAPATATGAWTDVVAGWLGLPWDAALDGTQKHRILMAVAKLGRLRGTRAGLETLLEALFPGTPRRFRLVDVGVDFGLVTLGGGSCTGTRLPAVLAGLPSTASVLSRKSIVGRARLPCGSAPDDGRQRFSNRLRIDVAATSAERRRWEPWFAGVIGAMVPATTRVQLRWLSPAAVRGDEWLSEFSMLRGEPSTRLGAEAITGMAVLPPRGGGISLQ